MRGAGRGSRRGLSVVPGRGRADTPDLVGSLEDRITAAASELQAMREAVIGLARAAEQPASAEEPVQPRLLTVAQAAAALGLGESTVHGLIRRGLLGSRKIGSARRVPVADLDAFVNGLPVEPRGA